MLDIELLTAHPAAREPLAILDARVATIRDEVEQLVTHQVVLDDVQVQRLADLRRGLCALSSRLCETERAADVLEARLADRQALLDAQSAEILSLCRRVAELELIAARQGADLAQHEIRVDCLEARS